MVKSSFQNSLPQVGEGERGMDGRIGYLLRQASVAHHNLIDSTLKSFQITLPQYSILAFCKNHPDLSGADLARLTLLTPQTISTIVTNLERRGLIERQAHPVHGRIQTIALTAKGQEIFEKCNQLVLDIQKDLLQGFSKTEETIIRRWLISVAKLQ